MSNGSASTASGLAPTPSKRPDNHGPLSRILTYLLTRALRATRSRWSRHVAATALVVFAVAGVPGSALHPVTYALTLSPSSGGVRPGDGVVDVRVRAGEGRSDASADVPLDEAQVRALAIADGRAYLVSADTTDAHGVARLARLPRGEMWIVADAPGRARSAAHLIVGGEPSAVTLTLGAEHTLEVMVKDERGLAVAGAEIEVASAGDALPFGARTGTDGVAHVGRLCAGPWLVTARAPGLEDATGQASRDGERVSLVLRKLGAITVHVADASGGPAVGARVQVAGPMLWPARAASTNERGEVRVAGLGTGTYALRATRGDEVAPIELGVFLDRGGEQAVTLRLGPGRFVGVRVTDGDVGDAPPVAGARLVLAEGGLSPFPLETTTDATGHARLGPIAPGGATLSARADGFVARNAVVVADPPPTETRIALERAGTLTGRVLDTDGYPVDGATIEVAGVDPSGAPIVDDPQRTSFQDAHLDAMLAGAAPLIPAGELGVMPGQVPPIPPASPDAAWMGGLTLPSVRAPTRPRWVTRDDGTFRLWPAAPGRVRVIVHHPQYVEAQSSFVSLAPGGEAHVDVVMHEGGRLEGQVLDATDTPVEGARVNVTAVRGSLERVTRTAADGSFSFAALPSKVIVTAGVDRKEDAPPDVRMVVDIPEGDRRQLTVRLPPARDPLPVTVVDDRGVPVRAAQVTVSSLAASEPLRATVFTDVEGLAHLARARGLPLRVEVSAPGLAPKVVEGDPTADALRIELTPAESATGRVISSRDGDPVAGARVTVYTALEARRIETNAQGEFVVRELAPGAATLRIVAAGFADASVAVSVPDSGGRRPFAISPIELAQEAVVEGQVVDASGAPIAAARVASNHVPTWMVVGGHPDDVAITDANGHFTLRGLPAGTLALEAYSSDLGRGRTAGVRAVSGQTTSDVTIEISGRSPVDHRQAPPGASVAVTLGETGAPVEVVIVSVDEGSAAERAGLAPGDVLLAVDGAPVHAMREARAKMSGPLANDVVLRIERAGRSLTMRVPREPVLR